MINNLSRYERETIIIFNDEDGYASVYTCNKALIKKLDTYCNKYPSEIKIISKNVYSKTYYLLKRLISIRKPRKISEINREKQSELMKTFNITKQKV